MTNVAAHSHIERDSRLTEVTDTLKAYVALTKPRIIELLLVTTIPTMFVASRHLPSLGLIALTLIGGTLAAGGANACNMVYDRDIDAVMDRTKNRPLVTGKMSPTAALVFALSLELGAFALLALTVNLLSAVLAVSATAFYVLVYTMWLKRSSVQNIVIGGAAGAVPVLVGWTSVTDHLSVAPFILFGIIFLWTPPHFWALAVRYREDYAAAKIPMLPVVADISKVAHEIIAYAIATALLSLSFGPVAHLNWGFDIPAFVLGALFCWKAIALARTPDAKHAMRLFGYSISYLTLLFMAMGIDAIVQHP
jgi:protoheme IX farnesyltransferase